MDEVANLWEKTKDPKYKELWYKLIKEFANGTNNYGRRDISSDTGDEKTPGRHSDNTRR
jgi:hypothetical protein